MNPKRMRIAQVSPLWTTIPPQTYGGIELLMKLHIDELVERGHDVTLFASADCVTRGKLHPVCEQNLTDMTAGGNAYCYEYYTNSMMAEVLRHAGSFDIIHYHLSSAWLPLAGAVETPGLFTLHTSTMCDDEWVFRRWPRIAVNGISRFQMKGASERLGREFPVVYNGCDFDAYHPRFEPGEYLAYLGRMSREKNPLGAIEIAATLGMPIVLAGQPQNGNEAAFFNAEVKPRIDDKMVRWIGAVNHAQKNEFLRHASALIFPIQWDEPFGLVMIEAMACGTPVVAHRRGSVEEVIDPGVTGFHAGTIDAMAALVPGALQLDREKVWSHARSRFGFRRMVDRYLEIYRGMVEK